MTPRPKPPYVEDDAQWRAFQIYRPGHPGGSAFRDFVAGWNACLVREHGLVPINPNNITEQQALAELTGSPESAQRTTEWLDALKDGSAR